MFWKKEYRPDETNKNRSIEIGQIKQPYQPTPTEKAFTKASQLDKVWCFLNSRILDDKERGFPICSRDSKIRYSIERGSCADLIIGYIEALERQKVEVCDATKMPEERDGG